MESEVGDNRPLRVGCFAPDEDFAIVRGGCEDGAVLGVCLVMTRVKMRQGFGGGERRTDP